MKTPLARLCCILIASVLAKVHPNGAAATTYTLSATVDPAAGRFSSDTNSGLTSLVVQLPFPPGPALFPGDSFGGTILFTNGESITVTDPPGTNSENCGILFFEQNQVVAHFQYNVRLLGTNGQLSCANPYAGSGQTSSQQSWTAFAPMIGLTTNSVSFTGFTYTFTLLPPQPAGFFLGNFQVNAGLGNIVVVKPVQIAVNDGSFGVRTNAFGFNVTGPAGQPLVVEAGTNPAGPGWMPLQTNTPPFYFSDPAWTNYLQRFYRARSQ